jgi:hypothetical protein
VLDGEEEWTAVKDLAEKQGKTGVWLNGQIGGSCPGMAHSHKFT